MGVQGLWQLIQNTGHPVTLESLEGKILAIDVSIWLNQSMKGMRDKFGNPLPNAHLLSLYRRLCKLLYYRIKPIFVFDGGVPILKKQTLASRHNRRIAAGDKAAVANKKLLSSILKHHALNAVVGGDSRDTVGTGKNKVPLPSSKPEKDDGLFELPPLPEADKPTEASSSYKDDYVYEEQIALKKVLFEDIDDFEDVDVDSEEFKALPPEIKHEVLSEIKEKRKRTRWAQIHDLPQESSDFSNYQLAKIMKQSKLSKKIENVKKEMNQQSTGDIAASVSSNTEHAQVETRRVVSDDTSHYILIKGLSKLKEDQKSIIGSDIPSDDELDSIEPLPSTSGTHKTAKSGKEIEAVALGEESSMSKEDIKPVITNSKINVNQSSAIDIDISDPDEDAAALSTKPMVDKTDMQSEPVLSSDQGGGFIREEDSNTQKKIPQTNPTDSVADCEYFSKDSFKASPSKLKSLSAQLNESASPKRKTDSAISQSPIKRSKFSNSDVTSSKLIDSSGIPDKTKSPADTEHSESSSSEEDFLEVTINPSAEPDDDLFPASIFVTIPSIVDPESTPTTSVATVISDSEPAPVKTHVTGVRDVEYVDEDAVIEDNTEETKLQAPLQEPERFTEFDGLSKEELEDLQAVLEIESSQLQKEKGKQDRLAASVTDQMYMECQDLLKLFGVPYIVSPMEAEAQCAYLDMTEQAAGTITDDSDIWLFGGQRVYRNFFNQNKHIEFYKLTDIKKQMTLNRRKLINLALLCGSDYTEGLKGVGAVTALEIMEEFPGGEEQVLHNFRRWWDDNHKKMKIPSETKVKRKLRQLELHEGFPSHAVVDAYLKPTVDDSQERFSWGSPDLDLIRQFALDRFGWTKSKVDESLVPAVQKWNNSNIQRSITSFFSIDQTETKKPSSKRVSRVVNRMRTGLTNDNSTNESSTVKSNKNASPKGKGKSSKKSRQTNVDSSASGSGFVQPVRVRCHVPDTIELSEESNSEADDLLDDPEGDKLLMSIDMDEIFNSGDTNPGTSVRDLDIASNRGKGCGRGKNRGGIASSSSLPKKIVSRTSLDGGRSRKRGRGSKQKSGAKNKEPVVLSDSGSSTD